MTRFLFCVGALVVLSLSAACTPIGLAAGAGASLGVAAAQEGGVRAAATDTAIRLQITDLWFNHDAKMYTKLSLTVKEGRVLIAGSVPKPQQRLDAVRLAWQAKGVKQVINEVRVDNSSKLTSFVTDSWITGNIEARLLLDKNVQSINYTIETVNGTVYVMGVAQDRKELQRVLDYARNTRSVKNVVSYVRMRGETPSGLLSEPTGSSAALLAESRDPAPSRGRDTAVFDETNGGWGAAPAMPVRVEAEPLN
jgi:osmotically-inducible protein OsmY